MNSGQITELNRVQQWKHVSLRLATVDKTCKILCENCKASKETRTQSLAAELTQSQLFDKLRGKRIEN